MDMFTRESLAHELVTVSDIAERSGHEKTMVAKWAERYEQAPRPVASTKAGRIYLWSEWEAWMRETGRMK